MAKRRIPKTTLDRATREANHEQVQTITKQFRAYFDASDPLRRQTKQAMDFMVGGPKQWDPGDYAKLTQDLRPALSFNVVHPTINFHCGVQQQRETDYRYFPRGTEDERAGRILTSCVKYVMDRGAGVHAEAQQFRQGVIGGLSILEVGHSYDYTDDLIEGDVTLNVLQHNTWYCDIMARRYDRNDSRYQGKLLWMTADAINAKWPGHEARIGGNLGDWLQYDPLLTGVPDHFLRELYDRETNRIRVLQHWYRVPVTVTLCINRAEPDPTKAVMRMASPQEADAHLRRIRDTEGARAASTYTIVQTPMSCGVMNMLTGQEMPVANEAEGQQMIDQIREDAGDQAASQWEILTRPTTALRVAHLTGWELLQDEPSPYGDDWRFPFSPFICFQDTDSLDDLQGVVRGLVDPQKEINWHHSTIVDTMARAPKGATWVLKGDNHNIADLKKQLPRAGFVGEYATSPPEYWPPQSFNPGDLAMTEVSNDFIMRHSSVNAEMVGATTQKTVSGRAVGARQAGGLVGLGTIFQHWQQTKEYTGILLLKRVQQFFSVEKMDRILGQEARMLKVLGLDLNLLLPPEQMYETLKATKDMDFDVVVGFQDATTTEREAQLNRMMQFAGIGIPVPPNVIVEMSDVPYKQEIQAALAQRGMQQPNPDLLKAVGAMQGQGADGVNRSQ